MTNLVAGTLFAKNKQEQRHRVREEICVIVIVGITRKSEHVPPVVSGPPVSLLLEGISDIVIPEGVVREVGPIVHYIDRVREVLRLAAVGCNAARSDNLPESSVVYVKFILSDNFTYELVR